MDDTIRKLIRDNLVATLRDGIFPSGTSAEHVSILSDEPVERRHTFPSITVHPVADEPGSEGAAMGVAARRATFALVAWTRGDDDCDDPGLAVADAVEALLGDIVQAVCADTSRGGVALDTSIGEVTFLLVTTGQRLAGVEIMAHVAYRHVFGDPSHGI